MVDVTSTLPSLWSGPWCYTMLPTACGLCHDGMYACPDDSRSDTEAQAGTHMQVRVRSSLLKNQHEEMISSCNGSEISSLA